MLDDDLNQLLLIVTIVSGGALWLLEGVAPFFRNRRARLKHALLNFSVAALNALVSSILLAVSLAVLNYVRPHWQGLKGLVENEIAAALLLIAIYDLWMYAWHRLNHAVAFFWRFHRFHHQDSEMDVTTGFRFHPLEIIFSEVIRVPILILLGMGAFEILLYNLLSFPIILMHHSNIALPTRLDVALSYFVPSPNVHRLHHSVNPAESNANFGSMLSIWDRLFGSFIWRENLTSLRLGVDAREV